MSIAQRTAEVVWQGTLPAGPDRSASGSGALELPVTWAARTDQPDGKPARRS